MSVQSVNETTNLGGVNQFSFIFENQLASEIEIIKGQAIDIDILYPDFTTPDLVLESGKFTENKKGMNLFEYKYTGKLAKDNYQKLLDCNLLDNNRIIALVKDNNNQTRLLGQKNNPAEIVIEFDKGQNVSDLNHYKLELTWLSKYRAAFMNATYTIPDYLETEDGDFLELE
jgi:hypothetical protein